jgi:uncharacterized RDD family membrane protein YckC
MTDEKLPFFERFDRFVKKLQGVAMMKHKRPPEAEDDPDAPRFATFQDRVIASVIDMGVIYLILQELFQFMTVKIYSMMDMQALQEAAQNRPEHATTTDAIRYHVESAFSSGFFDLWLLNSFAQSLVVGVILVLIWREFNTTLGKFIIGLEFAAKDGEGTPTTRQYLVRYAGFYLSMPIFMIGFAAAGLDKQKRAWHDRIAGTTVIYSERGNIFKQLWKLIKSQVKR